MRRYPVKAHVDPDLCIGCGLCPDVCPEVFEMGDDDKAHVIGDSVPPDAMDTCRDAVTQCPSEAIKVDE